MLSVGPMVLKIGFVLAKRVVGVGGGGGGGEGEGIMLCIWQLPWLAVGKPWSALAMPFLSFLKQMGSLIPRPLPDFFSTVEKIVDC